MTKRAQVEASVFVLFAAAILLMPDFSEEVPEPPPAQKPYDPTAEEVSEYFDWRWKVFERNFDSSLLFLSRVCQKPPRRAWVDWLARHVVRCDRCARLVEDGFGSPCHETRGMLRPAMKPGG